MGVHIGPSAWVRHPAIHTRDLDEARAAVARTFGDVSLDLRGDARRFAWRASLVDLGPVVMIPTSLDGDVSLRGTTSGHILQILRAGQLRTGTRGSQTELVGGRGAALFSPTGPAESRNDGEISSIVVRIDPSFVVGQLEALTGATVRGPVAFAHHVRTDSGPGARVERLCQFLLGEIERGSDGLTHPVVVNSLCEALARALLVGQPHDHAHLLEKPAPPSSRSVVRLVEEYLEAHAAEAVCAADLSALTGASVRAVEAAFRVHRGSTPEAFLRTKRLDRARKALLAPEPAATLRSVAHACGFLRLESFEAAYAAQFGESPAETRRRGLVVAPELPDPSDAASGAPGSPAARLALLSPREREVCEHATRGMLNKQIAAALGITERTVKAHRGKAMEKLGAESAAALGSLLRPG